MHDERIDRLHAAGFLSDLDRGFSRLVARLSGSSSVGVELAAALASRASVEGNICLDLAGMAGGSIPAGQDPVRIPELPRWVSALRSSPVVGVPGDWRPLVLDGTRLYLFRHWEAEQSLARFLLERSQVPARRSTPRFCRRGFAASFPIAPGGRTGSGSQRPWRF
jgi:exodeoxyribonuclease V alpha subunit